MTDRIHDLDRARAASEVEALTVASFVRRHLDELAGSNELAWRTLWSLIADADAADRGYQDTRAAIANDTAVTP